MAYQLHTNPDGLGWRPVVSWNKPYHVKQRYLRFEAIEEAEAAKAKRLHYNNQICRIVVV